MRDKAGSEPLEAGKGEAGIVDQGGPGNLFDHPARLPGLRVRLHARQDGEAVIRRRLAGSLHIATQQFVDQRGLTGGIVADHQNHRLPLRLQMERLRVVIVPPADRQHLLGHHLFQGDSHILWLKHRIVSHRVDRTLLLLNEIRQEGQPPSLEPQQPGGEYRVRQASISASPSGEETKSEDASPNGDNSRALAITRIEMCSIADFVVKDVEKVVVKMLML